MHRYQKNIRLNVNFLVFVLIIFASLLCACSNQQNGQPKPRPSNDNEKQNSEPTETGEEWKLPITIPEGEFSKVGGWVTEQQLLYITNLEQSSTVYLYDLITGKSKSVYKSEVPIVSMQLSPSKKFILIHSSPSTYEGMVTIISFDGEELLKQSFASFELSFEWNPFNESQVLVSAFNDDWTYDMQLMEIEGPEVTELTLSQPFNQWVGNEEIAFINWNDTHPTLTSPLMTQNLKTQEVKTIFSDVVQFSAYRDVLMTITVDANDKAKSIYSFYGEDIKQLFSFTIPHLTTFSGWFVPFYDLNEKGRFIIFQPVKSGDADAYSDGFQLVSYDLNKGSSNLIMEGLKNEPVLLSPSGQALLYGNKFEKLIDLSTKKIFEIVKE